MEKETATHSSILALKIPRTEEPDRLQSMGSQRWTDQVHACAHTHTHTRAMANMNESVQKKGFLHILAGVLFGKVKQAIL